MGLIYVNPEGPLGIPDPLEAAKHVRVTFSRMGMDDYEIIALIADGHTFGKVHGACKREYIEREPEAAPIEQQGLGWKNSFGTGSGADSWTSGLEGAWTNNPTKRDTGFFENLFEHDWELVESPGGAKQWKPKNEKAQALVPDAHKKGAINPPMMLTTDLALRFDPIYEPISRNFYVNKEEFELAFKKAWFKLTQRDMGPRSRYLGPLIPQEAETWQDPLLERDYELINQDDTERIKQEIRNSKLEAKELVFVAWAGASTFRATDKRGGINGARIALEPQVSWEINNPDTLLKVLGTFRQIKGEFDSSNKEGKQVSLADLIVLGGNVGIEIAGEKVGKKLTIGLCQAG